MNAAFLRSKARQMREELDALIICAQDPRLPWYVKALALFLLGYAFSPIDLIPDFIPVLGYLDDLVLIPAGIALIVRLVPKEILDECRMKAKEAPPLRKGHYVAAAVIVAVWIACALAVFYALWYCLPKKD
jgi:uncharacterized membrane protein YkvA (DUF1232 family)